MRLPNGFIPRVDFQPEYEYCTICGRKLKVLKTIERTVYTITSGPVIAHETIFFCPNHKYLDPNQTIIKKFHSQRLFEIVKPRQKFGYDVTVYIGRQRFIKHKTVEKIVEKLCKKGITISDSEVSYHSKRFLIALKCLHDLHDEQILKVIEAQGGYILHVDSTSDEDSDHICVVLDGLSGYVLIASKIRSENQKEVAELFRRNKERFGEPLLIMKDMAKGVENACREIFPNILIVECHFHFCRDVGKELFEPYYNEFKELLKELELSTELKRILKDIKSLAQAKGYPLKTILKAITTPEKKWIEHEPLRLSLMYGLIIKMLKHKRERSGLGVPFDLPMVELYRNCLESAPLVRRLLLLCAEANKSDKLLHRLDTRLGKLSECSSIKSQRLFHLCHQIDEINQLFNELRTILRINPTATAPLSDPLKLSVDEEKTMYDSLLVFHDRLKNELSHEDWSLRREKQIIVDHLDRHLPKLELPVIEIWTGTEIKQLELHRTNNIAEQHFRHVKRTRRKAHGRSDVGADLNEFGPYLSYVENLTNPSYFKLLFGSWEGFSKAISSIPESVYEREDAQFDGSRQSQDRSLHLSTGFSNLISKGLNLMEYQIDLEKYGSAYELQQMKKSNGCLQV